MGQVEGAFKLFLGGEVNRKEKEIDQFWLRKMTPGDWNLPREKEGGENENTETNGWEEGCGFGSDTHAKAVSISSIEDLYWR